MLQFRSKEHHHHITREPEQICGKQETYSATVNAVLGICDSLYMFLQLLGLCPMLEFLSRVSTASTCKLVW